MNADGFIYTWLRRVRLTNAVVVMVGQRTRWTLGNAHIVVVEVAARGVVVVDRCGQAVAQVEPHAETAVVASYTRTRNAGTITTATAKR